MEYTQQVLYDLPLPSSLISFKNNCLSMIVPNIQKLILYMESPQANNSYIFILAFILFFLIVKTIILIIFPQSKKVTKQNSEAQAMKELKLFRGEINNVRNILRKIVQSEKFQKMTANQEHNPNQESLLELIAVKELISAYRSAVYENQELSEYIIQSHEELMRELKKLKKLKTFSDRSPSNSSAHDFTYEPILQKIEEENGKEEQIIESFQSKTIYQKTQTIELVNGKNSMKEFERVEIQVEKKEETIIQKPSTRSIPPPLGGRRATPPPPPKKRN